jgi:F-type H+-transporting ATPase subunit alpha
VVSIFAGTGGYLDTIPVERVTDYESQMLGFMRSEHADVLTEIRDSREFTDATRDKVKAALDTFAKQFA